MADPKPSFFVRHEFLLRRIHSLTGLMFGGYMCVHLVVNASILAGPETFQNNVHNIHALGPILPLVEWGFILLPLLFHAFYGILILTGCVPNNTNYPYGANWRYTLQRITAIYLLLFILWHVFHMHGWFHSEWWLNNVVGQWGALFKPYNAASTAGLALQNMLVAFLYALGVVAGVFHFANGLWTAGITWGIWTRPHAQSHALAICMTIGVVVGVAGLGALWGMRELGSDAEAVKAATEMEDNMYTRKVELGMLPENEHKRSHGEQSRSGDQAELTIQPSEDHGNDEASH